MKLQACWQWLDDQVDEYKRLMMITGQTGRNPVYVRLRIDIEEEDGTTANVDQWIGKRLTAAQRRKLESDAMRAEAQQQESDQFCLFETALATTEDEDA